ncbi:MAG TPA: succinylglutamate-semialdehyde dehydrogenase [Sphingorhabdus sp.]|uniref:succinylglutamate-semialdehyde dehydrogenase n=1 Tax=Sphingorhabdus sp. TaxID=1902408 RepID=UPI002CC4DCB7|nr:succinylglutamate-semialdehyde dehydrogenase [Sphingorhabdus sp.]HMT40342.1 succinylglutamate-semialdehyde dehydrogenase [Sphingorhabdus sp.]HMU20809.1 succinylglutamate-semialdehyde dehydrogenase [Sphingorhabdus sp.]
MTELVSYEPATGAVLWRGATSDVDAAVSAARAAWPNWAAAPLSDRIAIVRSFGSRVKADLENFADCIARETGKPLWEARNEVESVVNKVDISVKAYADRTSQRRFDGKPGTRNAVRHKPHGVLAVLGPYNFPAHLPNGHIVPALIAGNAVVFKPSEKTPAVGAMLVEYFRKAGIPDGVVNIVQGGPDTGKALSGHPGLDGLLFTGSAQTGIALNRQFASRPDKILALEMGGNNPVIVWDTHDMHSAAVLVVQSAFLSAGQRCTAARRLIIKQSLYDQFIPELKRLVDRLVIDEPHAEVPPFMGPVIDNEAADGLTESFLALMSHGGRPIRHMTRPRPGRPFLSPGIIDVTDMRERPDIELFGPLLQVIRVETFGEAIDEANNTRFGLSASLIGGTPEQYNEFWANSRAGVVNWNQPTNGASSAAPFGGVGLSGNHRPSAYYAADYCAFPVVSSEADVPRAMIGIGLRDDMVAFSDDSGAESAK